MDMDMEKKKGYVVPEWQERSELLFGSGFLEYLSERCVVVAGLGGVGAYAAEMLARAGVGHLVIIDSDEVNLSNKNRQLLALDSTVGESKCRVMERRLGDINKELKVTVVNAYLDEESIEGLLGSFSPDFVVDAIDTLSPKIALIQFAVGRGIPLVSSMGAGAKRDATKVRLKDISKSYNCPLAYMLRKRLRRLGISKGFKVVFSEELPDREAIVPVEERNKKSQVGTVSYMPAVFGCVAAQCVLDDFFKSFSIFV
jgi:tRNA A37 threonylcarbamoyladenosine dehydratase